jgi:Holliday junction resolvase RusA-like endonuclease
VVVSSKVYRAWEDQAIMQVRQQWGDKPPLEGDLIADARIYQDKGQAIDATNALEGPWDVLEACGVIRNDYQLSSGSWVRYRDADDPRIEINLYKES